MFKRASLTGSADFFQETSTAPELLAETEPESLPAAIHQLPIRPEIQRAMRLPVQQDPVAYFEYQFTEAQVRALIEAVQKLKYPHMVKNSAKLSMEEFESMEALRQLLLEGLR